MVHLSNALHTSKASALQLAIHLQANARSFSLSPTPTHTHPILIKKQLLKTDLESNNSIILQFKCLRINTKNKFFSKIATSCQTVQLLIPGSSLFTFGPLAGADQ